MRIGQKVNRLVTFPSFGGKVLAVFSKNIYLLGRDGEILWLAKEGLPMHRRCITAPFQPHVIRPGQGFWISGSSLQVGEAMVIDLNQAEEWKPFVIGPEEADSMERVNDRVGQLFSNVPRPNPDSGFFPAIPIMSAIAAGGNPETIPLDPLLTRAFSPILAITKACLCEDIVGVAKAGRELIGLGPGLTPSGDDFLGGLLFALHFLKRIFPKEFFWDDQPILDLIDESFSRTHPISHTILSDLSLGHGPESLYGVVNSLLSGRDWDHVMIDINRTCEIGHTSGWDILTGLLTGMLMVREKTNQSKPKASTLHGGSV